ncbi:hypothetical protein [Pedobacter roseus]|uniref:Lipocalin-like domain-containing protein n=1 Tax=Pedobacter roseus TaxID=336820 RepID=A0A7G9QAX7_9SPHI|nr:hypothetical protein [Pedobacter roseus]QNN40502.1 hypothetical protein H9L23_15260 [Pedobacter roseus]
MKVQICVLLFAIFLSFGCKKPTSVDVLMDGNYTGVLVVTNSVKSVPVTRQISISLKDGKFNVTSDVGSTLKSLSGKGTYNFKNGTGYFADEGVWTADFDWNMILNGEYDIRSSGADLTLKRRAKPQTNIDPATSYATMSYEYILKRN